MKKEEGKSEVKEPEPKKTESVVEKKEKEKMEDTFEAIQPKQQDAGRKKEVSRCWNKCIRPRVFQLGDKKKAENKGDYKTWNKVIENSEFNKTLSEKDEKDGKKKTGKKDDEKKEDDDKK